MTDDSTQDLLGKALDADEQEILAIYRRLQALARRTDLSPCVTANVKQAMVMLWNACNDLLLVAEEPDCD